MKPRHIQSIAAACCAIMVVACGSQAPAKAADVVTPDQAKQAFLHMAEGSPAAFINATTGSLRQITLAQDRLTPVASAAATPDPSWTHDVTVWVAHQSQYPVSFLCVDNITVGGRQAAPNLYRLDKASASAPWTFSYQLLVPSPADVPSLAVDSGGYAQVISSDRYGQFKVSPASLGRDFAMYLTAANSADDHQFAPGQYTSTLIDNDNNVIRTAAQEKAETVTTTWSPTGDPVTAYLLNDGGALVLIGVQASVHVVPRTGAITITKDGKGVTGPGPGRYRDTTTVTLLIAAFIVPAKGSTEKVSAVGGFVGPVSSTARPA